MNAIINAKLLTKSQVLEDYVLIFDEKIQKICPTEDANLTGMTLIDGKGHFLSPGFVDIHKHGAYNMDAMDADDEGFRAMLGRLPETGVTALYPTTMAMSFSDIRKAIEHIGRLMDNTHRGTQVMGCHVEGPFLSPDWGGAQPREFIVPADYSLIEGLEHIVKLITIAPEEPGAMDFLDRCMQEGFRVSIGHTLAHYEDAIAAFSKGACAVTHTFCAMHQLQHREPGVVCAASESPHVYCELIADNLHIHPATQRALTKLKGLDHMILVTDSMRFAGMGYGVSSLAGQRVTIDQTGAHLDNGFFAGSVLSMNEAVIKFKRNLNLNMVDAIKPVTENPCKMMGIYGAKGILEEGADADLVLIDEDIEIYTTLVAGKIVFQK